MQATGTLVEKSDSADNYRAEALGLAAGLLVIKAATERQFRYLNLVAHCNNMGIVKHGNASDKPCLEKQVQADLIILSRNSSVAFHASSSISTFSVTSTRYFGGTSLQ